VLVERTGYRNSKPKVRLSSQPCFTIKAAIGTDGKRSNRNKCLNIVLPGGDVRRLTPRAIARLQSFPDAYELPKDMKDAGPLLGLAIPPLLAKSIFESFRGEVMEIKSDLKTLQVPAARTKINRMPLEIEEGGEVLVKEEDEKGFSPQSPSLRLPTLTTPLPSCESLPSLPHQCLGYSVACAIQPVLTSKVSTVGYATMEGEESKPAAVVPTKLVVGLHQVEIRLLVPHPCNASIYGEDEDVIAVASKVRTQP